MAKCWWEADEDENWDTTCVNKFVFIDDGPIANGFRYCPYCGKPLVEVRPATVTEAPVEPEPNAVTVEAKEAK